MRGETYDRSKSDQWGSSSASRSFEIESWSYIQHKDYQLHVLQKLEKLPSNRPVIPTTEQQRLAYFRGFSTSPFHTMVTYSQHHDYATYLINYVLNVIFRSFPVNYLHSFLAAYSPDEHVYANKMIPAAMGVSWSVIVLGICQLVAQVDILVLLCHYALYGFFAESPWHECKTGEYYEGYPGLHLICVNTSDFWKFTHFMTYNVRNADGYQITFMGDHFVFSIESETDEYDDLDFQPSPQAYFLDKYVKMSGVLRKGYWSWLPYFIFLWGAAGGFYKQIYRKYMWKTLLRLQLLTYVIYFSCIVFIVVTFLSIENLNIIRISDPVAVKVVMDFDIDFVAECFIGPPVIQMLLARSGEQVDPGRDSALITISNSFAYLFISACNLLVMDLGSLDMGLPIILSWFNEYPIFYEWHYLTAKYHAGEFMLRAFFVLIFLVEFLLFVITFQLLVETVVCEWRWGRRWVATVLLSTVGLTLSILLERMGKVYLVVIVALLTGLSESLLMLWMYPLGRLLDDVHFHSGAPIQDFRIWLFRIIPFYYMWKIATLITTFKLLTDAKNHSWNITTEFSDPVGAKKWGWYLPLTFVLLGAVYAAVKYLLHLKQSWRVLFRPRPDWGPRDHVVRQLRKQFDSRDYIGSQASRYLSRHMLVKGQTASYRLDIRYETASDRRRSTIIADNFGLSDDNKP